MKKLILLLTLLPCIAFGQGDTLWTKTFGSGVGTSVQQTTDGGYIIAASNASVAMLIKTNSQGATLWSKSFGGGANLNHHVYDVQQTSDGGYVLTGVYDDGDDVWLLKTDSIGNTLWTKTFGSGVGTSVQQTTDGGYIITGYHLASTNGGSDVHLIKTDENGIEQWNQTFGGTGDERVYSVQQATDGGYIITGYTESFGNGEADVWLIKTDESGNQQWSQTYGGNYKDEGYSVEQTTDGGYIIAGKIRQQGSSNYDVYLIKTDGNGVEQWSQTYGGAGFSDAGRSVQQTTDGGYTIAGDTYSFGNGSSDVYLIKTDGNGVEQWSQTYGGIDYELGYSVQQTTDGGYIITGSTYSFGNGAPSAIWLIKTVGQSILSTSFTNPDLSKDRKLEKVVDLLGRPSLPVPNQILLYKYSDGSVEKRILMER